MAGRRKAVGYGVRRSGDGKMFRVVEAVQAQVAKVRGKLHPVLTVVIPAYGKADLTQRAVASVRACVRWNCAQIVVVDDCGPEPIPDMFGVELIRLKRNVGFPGACNAGAKIARGSFLLFLNSDAELRPECVERMLDQAHMGADVVGAKLVSPLGAVQHVGMRWDDTLRGHVYVKESDALTGVGLKPTEVEAVSGACMLVRRSVFNELGGFDAKFGRGYFEDVDLCLRVWNNRGRVVCDPLAVAVHIGHASFGDGKPDRDLLQRSHRVFLQKWPDVRRHKALKAWQHRYNDPRPAVSVVVPVHNAASDAVRCLETAASEAGMEHVQWIVVDDHSDAHTADRLKGVCTRLNMELIRLPQNEGYMRAVLHGIGRVRSKVFCLLNSDTVPTRGWLAKMLRTMNSDSRIAVVNPVCNNAANLSVPIRPGADLDHMAIAVSAASLGEPVDIVYPVGMCMLIRTKAWNELHGFDTEHFPRGYGEETDFSQRAIEKGWRCVMDTSAFVYHRGKGSHGERGETMERDAVKNFLALHGPRARDRIAEFERSKSIENVRSTVFAAEPADTRPAIVFYANELHLCGGVLACYHLARCLSKLGWRAVVAGQRDINHDVMEPAGMCMPLVYKGVEQFGGRFLSDYRAPQKGVLVATIWFTAEMIAKAVKQSEGRFKSVYFVQDDESRFRFPNGELYSDVEKVFESYDLIKPKVANSLWVQEHLKKHGHDAAMIPVGVDTDTFYPRKKNDRFTVLAMCRHSTPRRGYELLASTYRSIRNRMRGARLMVYGQKPIDESLMEYVGQLPQERLADVMGRAHVLLEPSQYQGFGLPALEGMASGCAVVSTQNMGIDTFGVDGENCVIGPDDYADAILSMRDERVRLPIAAAARETAERFTWDIAAERWDKWLREKVL